MLGLESLLSGLDAKQLCEKFGLKYRELSPEQAAEVLGHVKRAAERTGANPMVVSGEFKGRKLLAFIVGDTAKEVAGVTSKAPGGIA
jgi:alkanesulfonate monooxygenase SsuD/methylene tetrahydromethanopterin reductase-like flavin-dependent oxidoreductase (luciferase family)